MVTRKQGKYAKNDNKQIKASFTDRDDLIRFHRRHSEVVMCFEQFTNYRKLRLMQFFAKKVDGCLLGLTIITVTRFCTYAYACCAYRDSSVNPVTNTLSYAIGT